MASKSEEIRQYMEEHTTARAIDVAKALKVSAALVYNVKSNLKKKRQVQGATSSPRGKAVSGAVGNVVAAAQLIKSCGGVESARAALAAAERISNALR